MRPPNFARELAVSGKRFLESEWRRIRPEVCSPYIEWLSSLPRCSSRHRNHSFVDNRRPGSRTLTRAKNQNGELEDQFAELGLQVCLVGRRAALPFANLRSGRTRRRLPEQRRRSRLQHRLQTSRRRGFQRGSTRSRLLRIQHHRRGHRCQHRRLR